MTIHVHNQLTKEVDEFIPQQPDRVSLYTCGPTVYDYLSVGNWAAYIYWDILVRLLEAHDYTVSRVLNITDVGHLVSDADEGQDKLEKGAHREGKSAWEVAAFYTEAFLKGMQQLNLKVPTYLAKATDYIEEQLELIRVLKDKGYTYQISDGIYFDTAAFPSYGQFAGLHLDAQKAGARVEFNPEKRNPSDFALWKFSPLDHQRDMEWETPSDLIDTPPPSPMGFPGWHLECSAMALHLLGSTIDIHTGGIDHIPVHHTNEIAQSEAATGQPFAHYWLHNDHLKVNGTKISKSLQNGYTLDDLKERGFSPQAFRLFVLQSHYRSEGNFTFENLEAAHNRLERWRGIAALRHQLHDTLTQDEDRTMVLYDVKDKLLQALDDDLNTPEALKVIDEAFTIIEQAPHVSSVHRQSFVELLEDIDTLLGLDLIKSTPDINDELKALLLERQRARDEKDWVTSDRLRAEIEAQGLILKDSADHTLWQYSK